MKKIILQVEFRTELQANAAGLLLVNKIPEVRSFTIRKPVDTEVSGEEQ